MTTRIGLLTELEGYSARAENCLRVMRCLERRAAQLYPRVYRSNVAAIWALEERWHKRRKELESIRGTRLRVTYDFADSYAHCFNV
jgi:hypothetical protein